MANIVFPQELSGTFIDYEGNPHDKPMAYPCPCSCTCNPRGDDPCYQNCYEGNDFREDQWLTLTLNPNQGAGFDVSTQSIYRTNSLSVYVSCRVIGNGACSVVARGPVRRVVSYGGQGIAGYGAKIL